MTTQSDWIEWEGGNCPVEGWVTVEVLFRSRLGSSEGQAKNWDWGREPTPKSYDIVAYRVPDAKAGDRS